MLIYKVINNNMVSVRGDDGNELMLKGLGLGYNKKPGDTVEEDKIENRFVLDDKKLIRQFNDILVDLDKSVVDACIDVIYDIKKNSKIELSDSLYVTLVDHVSNLIERLNEGIVFDNSVLWDIKRIYADEYLLALNAIDSLKKKLPYDIPEDEASFITLHIVNAEKTRSMDETFRITDAINDICSIVSSELPFEVQPDDYFYNRFIMHLRFMIENKGNSIKDVHNRNNLILQSMIVLYPAIWETVKKVDSYSQNNLGWNLSNDEELYLFIHLVQIFHR